MTEILVWGVLGSVLFLLFLILLIWGIISRGRKLILSGLAVLLVSVAVFGYMVHVVKIRSGSRTGENIYISLFGIPRYCNSVIIHSQDRVIPKVDNAIWLHFLSCPREIDRITSLHPYGLSVSSTRGWHTNGPLSADNWFKPETLGDSVIIYEWERDGERSEQKIFTNMSKTEVYCIDVAF